MIRKKYDTLYAKWWKEPKRFLNEKLNRKIIIYEQQYKNIQSDGWFGNLWVCEDYTIDIRKTMSPYYIELILTKHKTETITNKINGTEIEMVKVTRTGTVYVTHVTNIYNTMTIQDLFVNYLRPIYDKTANLVNS